MNLNIASIWAALVATGSAMLWLFTNIAWASDIEAIEARLIKQDIRELRREMKDAETATLEYLREEIEELIDELCNIRPNDRECNG